MSGELLSASHSGFLEKKPRIRGGFLGKVVFGGDRWKRREFRLNGQMLSYWDGSEKKGEINVKGCVIQKLVPEEAGGREFGFEVELQYGEVPKEKLFLAAENSVQRAKWISSLNAASKDEKWLLRPKTLLKKSGRDVAKALVAGQRDERQYLVVQRLMWGSRKAHFFERKQMLQQQLERLLLERDDQSDRKNNKSDPSLALRIRDVGDSLMQLCAQYAASVLQSFIRECASKRRLQKSNEIKRRAKSLQRAARWFLFNRRLLRHHRRRRAAHIIASMCIRRLTVNAAIRRLQQQPRILLIDDVCGEGIRFDEGSASHDFFFYVMSCYDANTDPQTQFKGANETRVENGYGLRTTSVFRSEGIGFNTLPIWKGIQGMATGSHVGCFIVITLVTKGSSSSSPEVFHGQAVVRLSEHLRMFDGRGTSETVTTKLLKYVAPLEKTSGDSILSINDAIHRKVEGNLSLRLHIPAHTHTMTGWLLKESGRMLSNEFKLRFFVLLGDYFWYVHSESDLGSIKKRIQCREVTALTHERSQGRECLRLHFTLLANSAKGSWLLQFPEGTAPAVEREWIRKLHRCCKALPRMDLNPGIKRKLDKDVKSRQGLSFLKHFGSSSNKPQALVV